MYLFKGQKLSVNDTLTDLDGTRYPPDAWMARRAELEITEVDDPVRPDDRFFVVTINVDGSYNAEPRDMDGLVKSALETIKQARQAALDDFAKSAGISAVYDENLLAAQRFTVGDGSPMRDGQTPTAYLSGMGAMLGMTPEQFAAYIISENGLAAQAAVAIEKVYLEFAYQRLPAATFESLQTLIAELYAVLAAAIEPE